MAEVPELRVAVRIARHAAYAALVAGAALFVYARTADYGLISDDFGWLVSAMVFEPGRLFELDGRTHFYRPVIETYFPAALAVCGKAASCYHWLSISIHITNCLLVACMAGALSRTWAIGALAGLLFAVMSTPVEAVAWVSAVCELLATLFFVLTIWLFHRAVGSHSAVAYAGALLSFLACLLSHESGITLLPILLLSLWLLDPRGSPHARAEGLAFRNLAPHLAPFVGAFLAYGLIAWIVNSRNYVVNEGHYGVGLHLVTNVLNALTTMFIVPRSLPLLLLVAAFFVWAATMAPRRVRLYAIWAVVTLVPFAGFRDGDLPSRYLYLSAVGFSALAAELLWLARSILVSHWRMAGPIAWAIVTVALTVRFAVFAARNARIGESNQAAYSSYAAAVRAKYPSVPSGALIEVPVPPPDLPAAHVATTLQWEFDDPALRVVMRTE